LRIVIDTNVLVSAMLTPDGNAWRVVLAVTSGMCKLLLDERIMFECRSVLKRSKFGLNEADVDLLCDFLERVGEIIVPMPISSQLPDANDLSFIEVAVSGKADVIVTGNSKHYPSGIRRKFDLTVLTPTEFLAVLK